MTRLLMLILLAAALAAGPPTAAVQTAVTAADTVKLDGVTVQLRKGTKQVVTVNRTEGHHARIVFWTLRDGKWRDRFRAQDGRIGYAGLVPPRKRVQGSGKTPLGTHRLPWAFGMRQQQDRWDPGYRKVRKGDHWVLDNKSKHYNRYRNKAQGGFRWRLPASHPDGSERLSDYRQQYEYSVVTSFNSRQVRHRGGAIFLHVNGSGATAGCVSAPRWFLRRLMVHLDQDSVPVIAIGR